MGDTRLLVAIYNIVAVYSDTIVSARYLDYAAGALSWFLGKVLRDGRAAGFSGAAA